MTDCKDVKDTAGSCKCPYCDGEIECVDNPTCQPCGVSLRYCPKCEAVVAHEATSCPQCGGELQWKE